MPLDDAARLAESKRYEAELDQGKADSTVKHIQRLLELNRQKAARDAAATTQRNATISTSNGQSRQSSIANTSESDDPLQGWATRKHRLKSESEDVKKESEQVKKEPSEEGQSDDSGIFVNEDPIPAHRARQPVFRGDVQATPNRKADSNENTDASVSTSSHARRSSSNTVPLRTGSDRSANVSASTSSHDRGRPLDATTNALTGGHKRPLGFGSLGARTSKAPRQSQVASTITGPLNTQIERSSTGRVPPEWYSKLAKPNTRQGGQSNADVSLLRLKGFMRKISDQQSSNMRLENTEYQQIRDRLHTLTFLEVDKKLLKAHYMLHNSNGLPVLFDSDTVPWDIKADAEELYNKWCTGEFETDIYRGIIRGKVSKGKGKGKADADGSSADSLEKDYRRFRLMEPKQHGNGRLLNGAWWPSQLAALRDGAHGASQGGITGSAGEGAYSVILAGGLDPSGRPYPNKDNGDEVLYCGTDNAGPKIQPSVETQYMLENEGSQRPVRLIRSHNLRDSPHAPALGFRYDGLYNVVSHEIMDAPDVKRQRLRFRLVRTAGQDPIRSTGPQKRPTEQEIEAYEKDRKNRGR